MDEHTYRVIEIVGSSHTSIEDAINSAIARAETTIRNLRWFEVLRTSGQIEPTAAAAATPSSWSPWRTCRWSRTW